MEGRDRRREKTGSDSGREGKLREEERRQEEEGKAREGDKEKE